MSWRRLPKGWGGLFGGVSLIGFFFLFGFGCGSGWGGVRGVLRIVFLIPANPFQAQSVAL